MKHSKLHYGSCVCLLTQKYFAANERVIFDLFGTYGPVIPSYIPLGLTIDTKGFLWVALYYGSAVLKIDPR